MGEKFAFIEWRTKLDKISNLGHLRRIEYSIGRNN